MHFKILFLLIIIFSGLARAQEVSAPAVSPAAAALEEARAQVRADRADDAIATLEALAAAGFTAVTAITGDPVLSQLAGDERFDALVAAMEIAAWPCEHDPAFREFDFWLGQWEVRLGNGTLAGHNLIERQQHGCVLAEEWTSASGGTGSSINYVDKTTGEWVQVWNDASGSQINIRGGMTDQGMLLSGTIHYVGNASTAAFRGLWTPLPDGRVRQFFEQSNDGGESWSPWFEGFYSRREGDE